MNRIVFATALLLVFGLPERAGASLFLSGVSVNIGFIETFHRDDPDYSDTYALYPEAQISGGLFLPSLRWVAFIGGWDDGVDSPVHESGIPTYSFRGAIWGMRMLFKPRKLSDNWPLPVGVFAGVSRHAVTAEYIGGADPTAVPPAEIHRRSNTFEIGIMGEKTLGAGFSFRGEARQFIPFPNDPFEDIQKSRRSYTIGISASF